MTADVLSDRPPRRPAEDVRRLAAGALASAGLPPAAADAVAGALVESSLAGVHTHGVRLLGTYLDELERGVADAAAEPRVVNDTGAVVQLDAGGALGIIAGLTAAGLAVERARRHGVGLVGVANSNHFGAAGVFARRISKEGLLGFVTSSAAARVAASGAAEPVLGTNPVAVAFGDEFCVDMATSQVCFNLVKEYGRVGRPLPEGWAVRSDGAPAVTADEAATLAPLGGYKGQGLGMVVSILTAVLVGGPVDRDLTHVGASPAGAARGVAHLLVAVDPDVLGGGAAARERLGRLLDDVREAPPVDGAPPPIVPGDRRRANEARQRAHGLELDDATEALLRRIEAGRDPR